MSLVSQIARRYFFSRKKRSFIHLIALISMLGVGIGTMALVVVLSVFNGLEAFNRSLFKTVDADLRVLPQKGRYFTLNAGEVARMRACAGVARLTEILEENALVQANGRRVVATLKGTSAIGIQLSESLLTGTLPSTDGSPFALVGVGVATMLDFNPNDPFATIEAWYPNRDANLAVPSADAFHQTTIIPTGIFAIEQSYDDKYLFLPLKTVEALAGLPEKRSALEIQLLPNAKPEAVKTALSEILGTAFRVQTPDEQHATLYRAIRIEKLFVFVTLSFIIGIASFNIFFSLTLLTIEKQPDVATLVALGAKPLFIKQIFLAEGGLIALSGAGVGLVLGLGLCALQAQFGFVKMGLVGALVDAYPVKVLWQDVLAVVCVIVCITLAAAWLPAHRAAQKKKYGNA